MSVYILKDKKIIKASMDEWNQWMNESVRFLLSEREEADAGTPHERYIGTTKIGEHTISTVFLGIDHNWLNPGNPPVLFETMIFPEMEYCERTSTYEEALKSHEKACDYLRSNKL